MLDARFSSSIKYLRESRHGRGRWLEKNGEATKIAYHCAMQWRIRSGFAMALVFCRKIGLASELPNSVDSSEGWKLASGSKDVAIYSRAHAGSQLKEFRAIGSIYPPPLAGP